MTGSTLNERGVFVATRESAIYVVYDYGGLDILDGPVFSTHGI